MRGKLSGTRGDLGYERNIPAYAGKTFWYSSVTRSRSEHPRVCGENITAWSGPSTICGTSPRMRGKQEEVLTPASYARNIPAYAGKTFVIGEPRPTAQEHPRVCGENATIPNHFREENGTSPRMRGKLATRLGASWFCRNIPAYAGKTFCVATCVACNAEHPRVCGENVYGSVVVAEGLGTSPRMRGKRAPKKLVCAGTRNIPAHAGKTMRSALLSLTSPEHPRACGENPGRPRLLGVSHGNIPAHAGKTIKGVWRDSGAEEHPRACGENKALIAPEQSPQGNIPAHAGKTYR